MGRRLASCLVALALGLKQALSHQVRRTLAALRRRLTPRACHRHALRGEVRASGADGAGPRSHVSLGVLSLVLGLVAPAPLAYAVAPTQDKAALALKAAREGALSRRQGDLVKACRAFERAAELTPTWAVARLELGRCYRLLGDPNGSAAAHLKSALKWLPKWSLIHIELGRIAEDERRLEDAGKAYERAEELAPADIRAASGAARLASSPREAGQIARLRRILKRQPGNLALLRELADKTEARGAFAEAEAALVEILKRSQFRGRAAARLALFGERTKRSTAIKTAQDAFSKLRKRKTKP